MVFHDFCIDSCDKVSPFFERYLTHAPLLDVTAQNIGKYA